MIFFRIIFLQLCWFAVVLYGKSINPFWQIIAGFIVVFLDFALSNPKVTLGRYLLLISFFITAGLLNDSALIWLNMIYKNSYQYGNLSLWIIFIAYYERVFAKFRDLPLLPISLVGGIAGAFTYWSAARLGGVVIVPGMENKFLWGQFLFWAVFFPVSLKIYFKDDYWSNFLDKTIMFSFDKSGFVRHREKFTEDFRLKNIIGKNILVTGATAGIGNSAASSLSALGARVLITGRNQLKGEIFEEKNNNSKFFALDTANWSDVYEFAKTCESLDYVVFNAGSMPEKLAVNESGVEYQCASQLLGHYYLLTWLKNFKKLTPGARIVWVSSGGMYLKKLDLSSLFYNSNYEKVETYANVKRAQVTLVEELAKNEEWSDYHIYSIHPGWVNTDGLKEALPKFYKFMQKRLRSPEEGADTILWCLLAENAPSSGGFYFDRKKVSPYISKKYFPNSKERILLMESIEKIRGIRTGSAD